MGLAQLTDRGVATDAIQMAEIVRMVCVMKLNVRRVHIYPKSTQIRMVARIRKGLLVIRKTGNTVVPKKVLLAPPVAMILMNTPHMAVPAADTVIRLSVMA